VVYFLFPETVITSLRRLSEVELASRDCARDSSVLSVRARFLEEENGSLQQRVTSLTRQKHSLERVIKEYQLERQRQVRYRGWDEGEGGGGERESTSWSATDRCDTGGVE
jgi:hypothetical protein